MADKDLVKLFMPFGGPKTVIRMHYNAQGISKKKPIFEVLFRISISGRPLGSAEVVFPTSHFAKLAYDTYHDVPLDGYPMRMKMENQRLPKVEANLRLGSRPTLGLNKAEIDHRPQPEEKLPSAEELDVEMDEYMKASKKIFF